MTTTYDYDLYDAADDERDAWCDASEAAPFTHTVEYRPDFVIKVKLPPWVDPDAWLAQATQGWNDWLSESTEAWTEPAGWAFIEIEVIGSLAAIADVAP